MMISQKNIFNEGYKYTEPMLLKGPESLLSQVQTSLTICQTELNDLLIRSMSPSVTKTRERQPELNRLLEMEKETFTLLEIQTALEVNTKSQTSLLEACIGAIERKFDDLQSTRACISKTELNHIVAYTIGNYCLNFLSYGDSSLSRLNLLRQDKKQAFTLLDIRENLKYVSFPKAKYPLKDIMLALEEQFQIKQQEAQLLAAQKPSLINTNERTSTLSSYY